MNIASKLYNRYKRNCQRIQIEITTTNKTHTQNQQPTYERNTSIDWLDVPLTISQEHEESEIRMKETH